MVLRTRTAICLLVFSAITIMVAPVAHATTTYSYVGAPFSTFFGAYQCPSVCNITGWFTVAQPFAANTPYGGFTPLAFSFTDGVDTYTDASPSTVHRGFSVGTDAAGDINLWAVEFDVYNSSSQLVHIMYTCNEPFCAVDPNNWTVEIDGPTGTLLSYAEAYHQGGTWTMSSTSALEPGTLILLGSGLAAMSGRLRRKSQK